MIQGMNEFLTHLPAAFGNTDIVGSRQADVEERKLARHLARNTPKFNGDGIGTWKWKVEKCSGTRCRGSGEDVAVGSTKRFAGISGIIPGCSGREAGG